MRALCIILATLAFILSTSPVEAGTRSQTGPFTPSAVLDTAQAERG